MNELLRPKSWPFLILFAVFYAVTSSRWLLEAGSTRSQSTYINQAVGCLMAAGLVGLWALRTQNRGIARKQQLQPTRILGQVLVLGGAALSTSVAGRHISSDDATLSLALAPVVIAVASSAWSESNGDLPSRLWPGLAGVAGLLLLLPQPALDSPRPIAALVLLPILTGGAAALASRPPEDEEGATAPFSIAVALLFASALFLLFALQGGHDKLMSSFALPGAALDGLIALLSLAILRRAGSVRWGAQFLLVPLFTLLEGLVVMRPFLDLRSWMAFLLLAFAGGYLLFVAPDPARPPVDQGRPT